MTHIIGSISLISSIGAERYEHAQHLFDEIDAKSYDRHYVIVPNADFSLYEPFHSGRRVILPMSELLPEWVTLTLALRWFGRAYHWSSRSLPLSDWHLRQLAGLKAAATLPDRRFCWLDGYDRQRHRVWIDNAYAALGLSDPNDGVPDWMAVWERDKINAMLTHIERASGIHWDKTLARIRHVSAHDLYATYVCNETVLRRKLASEAKSRAALTAIM
jgi:hypothetical protein